ncbi:MerR family transcriptional regulator [Nonomuraea rubra]
MTSPEHTVGAIAELTGSSVRTLHHYDEIGLLEPSERSPAGYRLYSGDDLRRLQRILFYRELDFDLDTIGAILADPARTDADRLREQRELLTARIDRQRAMAASIDRELDARRLGLTLTLTPQERLEIFGSTRLEDDAARAKARWGGSELWDQRRRRVAAYSAQDWARIRDEQADIHQRIGRNYDDMAPGLSRYVHDAIMANADRGDRARSQSRG